MLRFLLGPVMTKKKTAFDSYVARRMQDPAFASAYAEERAAIDSIDALVRKLDEARLLVGISKADLARQIEARPEVVRRLFTTQDANPTLATVLKLADALGFHLELVRNTATSAPAPKKGFAVPVVTVPRFADRERSTPALGRRRSRPLKAPS